MDYKERRALRRNALKSKELPIVEELRSEVAKKGLRAFVTYEPQEFIFFVRILSENGGKAVYYPHKKTVLYFPKEHNNRSKRLPGVYSSVEEILIALGWM